MRHMHAFLGIIFSASENLALFFTELAKRTTSVDTGGGCEHLDT